MIHGTHETAPLAGPRCLAFDEVGDLAQDGSVLHRDRTVARDRTPGLRQQLAVGDVQELEEPDPLHPIAIQPQQYASRLEGLIEIESEIHAANPPLGPAPWRDQVCSR